MAGERLDRRYSSRDRAVACFQALAIGDAIGKQTETLSRADVLHWYPEGIQGFHGNPGDAIPRYRGNRRYQWRIGETTDDTEQTLAVARAIVAGQPLTHTAVGHELLRCRKSLHPGVSMWAFHQANNPERVATDGDGCGAAMRVAPVGVIHSPGRFPELIRDAREASIPTHGGAIAVAAAAAVAAAVSAAIEGWPTEDILQFSVIAARAHTAEPRIAASIETMYNELRGCSEWSADRIAGKYFPDRPETKVPLAIVLALLTKSAKKTTLLVANIGGDSDTVASIGSAIAGALDPGTVHTGWWAVVQQVNGSGIISHLAEALVELRH